MLPTDYSAYDVQEKARKVLLDLKTDSVLKSVKDYAFENAINVDSILNTGGLWLRDDFLGEPRKMPKND